MITKPNAPTRLKAAIGKIVQWLLLRTLGIYSPSQFYINIKYRQEVLRWNKDPGLARQAEVLDNYFKELKRVN